MTVGRVPHLYLLLYMQVFLGSYVVLHTRNSINETIDVISKYKGRLKGVFHCFDGDYEQLKMITNLGFKIGLGGIITFKNSKLKEVISRININDIVLETDSPYLSPEPYRGKRNEPYNISFIADKLSQILSIPYDNVCEVTSRSIIISSLIFLSKPVLSFLKSKKNEYTLDTNTNGELRAFVQTGIFEKVLPMDILPTFLFKAILANDYDEMEELGIYELIEEDIALCEFVDVSKNELQKLLRRGLNLLMED